MTVEFDLASIFSLWVGGFGAGIVLAAIPFILGVTINFALGLFKK